MNSFWSVSIKIEQENEKGIVKKVSEKYLVEAVSPTDVEVIMAEKLSGFNYTISNISIKRYVNVKRLNNTESFWDVTLRIEEEDDKGKIKFRNELQLFEASDASDAEVKAKDENGTCNDYTIPKVCITKYVDVLLKPEA